VERFGHPDGDIAVLRVREEALPAVQDAIRPHQVTDAQGGGALDD